MSTRREIDAAGDLLNDQVRAVIAEHVARLNGFLSAQPVGRLTRRERLAMRVADYRGRVALALDVLRDRHDCGYY